ncbi:MAG TPA: PilZ domain-containing protein [Stellaceae bacterium]|nr:PilZ domain-containing protein [Stellaceae bacterium]
MLRRVVRTNYDRREFRRDRRYPVPPILVRVQGRDYKSLNWSLGGFRIDARDLGLAVGDGIAGSLQMTHIDHTCDFIAEIVWTHREEGDVGAKFTEIAPDCLNALDRALSRWLARSKR